MVSGERRNTVEIAVADIVRVLNHPDSTSFSLFYLSDQDPDPEVVHTPPNLVPDPIPIPDPGHDLAQSLAQGQGHVRGQILVSLPSPVKRATSHLTPGGWLCRLTG